MQPVLKNIYQVAIVCRDTAAMVKKFADLLGIGPWQLVNFGPHCCKDMTLNGQRADYAMALAGWDTGAFEFEFCQPLDEKSLYAKQLQEYGEGLQHVAYAMDMDFDGAVDFFRKKGISVVQSGNWHGCCGYYYMDTQKLMKHTLEIHNQDLVEKAKYGPEGRYPELGMAFKVPPDPLRGEADRHCGAVAGRNAGRLCERTWRQRMDDMGHECKHCKGSQSVR